MITLDELIAYWERATARACGMVLGCVLDLHDLVVRGPRP